MGRNGKCYTVGYVSPITGECVPLVKPKVAGLKSRREVAKLRERDMRALERKCNGTWVDGFDDVLYPELAS